jgi:acyl-CoA reductase-like NAD-dependent aldehyde dehydrogenase
MPATAIPQTTDTSIQQLDVALERLKQHRDEWASLQVTRLQDLLSQLEHTLPPTYQRLVNAGAEYKSISPSSDVALEEWAMPLVLGLQIRHLKQSLREIERHGTPQIPGKFTARPDNRLSVGVLPRATIDRVLLRQAKGEVWFNPDISERQIREGMARPYRQATGGKIALVLAAGNAPNLIPGDFLYKLFVERQVVIVKMNPVNEYVGPIFEDAYAPLIEAGYIEIVYGGVDVAQYLIHHDLVDELHMTGADATHDAIVFGTGNEGRTRKHANDPIMSKRFTSELGNVSPMIIYPGEWSPEDIRRVATTIVTQLFANAGHYCLSPRLVVTHEGWSQRDAFVQAMDDAFEKLPDRKSYYPRVEQRRARFLEQHPTARQYGNGNLPWTFAMNVDHNQTESPAFTLETFCGVISEVGIPGDSPDEYLRQAVDFVNEHVWGTLTASLMVPTQYENEPAVERAIADLRYGSVVVNGFGTNGYTAMSLTWGGHAGSTPQDIQSGIGFVNNMLMFDEAHIQKSVLRMPFSSVTALFDVQQDRGLVNVVRDLSVATTRPTLKHMGQAVWTLIRSGGF